MSIKTTPRSRCRIDQRFFLHLLHDTCIAEQCGILDEISQKRLLHAVVDDLYNAKECLDSPAEGLSAFALEADDIRILIRDVTSRSLAAVDELGRGTAPKEGAAIVGAVLEELDQRGCLSIFATHLHEELGILPLNLM